MAEYATKLDLKEFGEQLGKDIAETVRRDFRKELHETKSDIILHFNASQGKQNERMDRIEGDIHTIKGKLHSISTGVSALQEDMAKVKSAVLDLLATDRHLHNLVRELKRNGIPLDEARVFAV